jgi:DNA (cytosine-5)-methyltransferase 1
MGNEMPEKLRVLDLFSGIGGFSLGLERTGGFETVAFCEIDPYCRAVLRKHWPDVPIFEDVRSLTGEQIGAVDVICGGFPCQDLSIAGKTAGLAGERSGLWSEIDRLIGDLRPAYAIMENVTNLLAGPSEQRGGWFGRILGDLAEIRFDAEWHCIRASRTGLPHHRDRIWLIAYPIGSNEEGLDISQSIFIDSEEPCRRELTRAIDAALPADDYAAVRGNHDGVPKIMGALSAYGNAVVPQIPEIIGRAILEAEGFSMSNTPQKEQHFEGSGE